MQCFAHYLHSKLSSLDRCYISTRPRSNNHQINFTQKTSSKKINGYFHEPVILITESEVVMDKQKHKVYHQLRNTLIDQLQQLGDFFQQLSSISKPGKEVDSTTVVNFYINKHDAFKLLYCHEFKSSVYMHVRTCTVNVRTLHFENI